MEKDFVPYELAVKLKAIGFNEECFGAYHNENYLDLESEEYDYSYAVKAPLFQQAFRWFREKYGFPSYVDMDDYSYYRFTIYKGIAISDAPHETYEEAELACLTKLIEIVETRTK